jgi:hypothetical protein
MDLIMNACLKAFSVKLPIQNTVYPNTFKQVFLGHEKQDF